MSACCVGEMSHKSTSSRLELIMPSSICMRFRAKGGRELNAGVCALCTLCTGKHWNTAKLFSALGVFR